MSFRCFFSHIQFAFSPYIVFITTRLLRWHKNSIELSTLPLLLLLFLLAVIATICTAIYLLCSRPLSLGFNVLFNFFVFHTLKSPAFLSLMLVTSVLSTNAATQRLWLIACSRYCGHCTGLKNNNTAEKRWRHIHT